ncbi:spermine oxidase-like [Leptopilina heterotoma]|uniref:spermine oxidase-like n=1 Tax=Leptopilina heterotoma TaxID=63436 RepID=UPI001CA8794E|nr:spermine oxidase-like [Leptopilina heterotoma]
MNKELDDFQQVQHSEQREYSTKELIEKFKAKEHERRKEEEKREELIRKNFQTQSNPSVIILGAGSAGIAAASRLFENGFKNVKILEAENRIGGRVFTTKFDDYLVDIGGQWVNGEVGNVAFDLAWPLGLLEKGKADWSSDSNEELIDSSGHILDKSEKADLLQFHKDVEKKLEEYIDDNENASIGVKYKYELEKFVKSHPKWRENKKGLTNAYNRMTTLVNSAENWEDITTADFRDFESIPGACLINWKERGYGMIFDIMMKRYPKIEEELPIMCNTKLNSEVSLIDYSNQNGKVIIKTTNGDEYSADYVIVTFSIGVLKEIHKSLFKPHLPEEKQKAIEGINYGNLAKIFLVFDEPWWTTSNEYTLLWKDKDFEIFQKDKEKSWLQGLIGFLPVEHKPKLLCGWVTGKHSRDLEELTDEQVLSHCIEVLHIFFGKIYNVTKPTGMIRSMWDSNKHFRGTNSYRSPKTDPEVSSYKKMSEPIGAEKPVILFAGEATHPRYFSAVHGAIESGYREADRIIKLHENLVTN